MKKGCMRYGVCILVLAGLLGNLCGCGAAPDNQGGERAADRDGGAAGAVSAFIGDGEDTGTAFAEGGEEIGTTSASAGGGNDTGTVSGAAGNGDGTGAAAAGGVQASGESAVGASGESGTTDTGGMRREGATAVTDFGLRLLRQCSEAAAIFPPGASMPQDVALQTGSSANILVSPLSVITALAMTAGGAAGETRAQMEKVFGMPVPELADYLAAFQERLPEAEKYKLAMANSIWFTSDNRFAVEEDFLQENERRFGAAMNRVPFDDSTAREINEWVKEKTDGMIEEILDGIPADAVMYLVNALAFDAQWKEIYYDTQVQEGTFTKADGTVQKVDLMYSTESRYREDAHAEGFLKEYAEGKYAFAALLPEEGLTVQEYLSSLDGDKLRGILTEPQKVQVSAAIPKYESEYGIEMSKVLQAMGMEDAFDSGAADFSGIGYSQAGNIFIGRVLHKTFVAVDEKGTKAGAATAVEMQDECAMEEPPVVKCVFLDRPFVYMILDTETNVPIFMGIVEDVG